MAILVVSFSSIKMCEVFTVCPERPTQDNFFETSPGELDQSKVKAEKDEKTASMRSHFGIYWNE